ncbi:hypothetical protein PUN28_010782 [Cardiocondyla obscurior]|uniref:Uncharacterized protein n=1 Tax=Cardiocondyla obscurior TaxID=286306 RepID=A0AAW2FHQ6_9HYME
MRYYDIDEGADLAIMRVITCCRANQQSMERPIGRSRGRFNRDQWMIGVPMPYRYESSRSESDKPFLTLASKRKSEREKKERREQEEKAIRRLRFMFR